MKARHLLVGLFLAVAAVASATKMDQLELRSTIYMLGTPTAPAVTLGTPTPGNVRYCANCVSGSPCAYVTPGGSATPGMDARAEGRQWNCGGSGGGGGGSPAGSTGNLQTNGGSGSFGAYAGNTCPTPQIATGVSASGALSCGTPMPASTGIPGPTPTPLANISYSAALNVTGQTAISASATPVATDRVIKCTSGSSSDQTYTLPASSGGGRVLDVCKVDSGTKNCIVSRAGSDTLNGGATTRTLSAIDKCDTCYDISSGHWICRGDGT